MATIRANCPSCGDVELLSRDMTVQICADTTQGAYTFQCDVCGLAVATLADEHIVTLLVSSGVRMNVWSLPAELQEPHRGEPISWDDAITFHDLLETDDWFDVLLARSGDAGR